MSDKMVLQTQQWLNKTYGSDKRYNRIAENGKTGWDTIYALTRAFQIELGIQNTADNFGPSTQNLFKKKYPYGIRQQNASDKSTSNVYSIIQGSLWCKGYSTGNNITQNFYAGTGEAIKELKRDIGFEGDSTVTLSIMKVLLSMQQFKLLLQYGGKRQIRLIQQCINSKYIDYTGIIPADGVYGREMNTALIQVLQAVEGYSPDSATGNFGAGTRRNLKTLNSATSDQTWLWVATAALVCNGYLDAVKTSWDQTVDDAVSAFQNDYALPNSRVIDTTTWMSLFTSKGNPDRTCQACDCATVLNAAQAKDLRLAGYTHVGRYLMGTYGNNNVPKALNLEEISFIKSAQLAIFPIYEDGGYELDYFSAPRQGIVDAVTAIRAARRLGIPSGTIIYFAVDFDAYEFQIDGVIKAYFQQINSEFMFGDNSKGYKIGVYGPRLVCKKICDSGYAVSSFVADMSTGFSGNLGYGLPKNWAYDQFHEFIFSSKPSFPLDKVAYSKRDPGVSKFDTVLPKKPDDLAKEDRKDRIQIARLQYIKDVLKSLGLYNSFITVEWEYNREILLSQIHTVDCSIDTFVTISASVVNSSDAFFKIGVSVDNTGGLSASTLDAISSSCANFDIKNIGSNQDFSQKIKSIAQSVKSGNISYTYERLSLCESNISIAVSTGNVLPNDSGNDASITVTLKYHITFHDSKTHLPELNSDTIKQVVAVVAASSLAVLLICSGAGEAGVTIGALTAGIATISAAES